MTRLLAVLVTWAWGACALADEPVPRLPDPLEVPFQLIELVHERHVEPPTRQELALAFVRELYQEAGVVAPIELAEEFSQATPGECHALVRRHFRVVRETIDQERILPAVEAAIGSRVPTGTFGLTTQKDAGVNEQLASNRYVGVGIQLSWDRETSTALITRAFPGGPLEQAGVPDKTRILKVDGQASAGSNLVKVVNWLRGPEGSQVELLIQRPGAAEPETVVITRGVVPLRTVEWSIARQSPKIALIRVERVAASTAHELLEFDRKAREEDVEAIVIELTGTIPGDVHDTALFADQLLDVAPLGGVMTREGTREFVATPDALFGKLPVAVLIDHSTRYTLEWLAAALGDNGRAALVGRPTAGLGYAHSVVPVEGTQFAAKLATGVLLRADGQDLRGAYSPMAIAVKNPETGEVHDVPVPVGADPRSTRGRVEPHVSAAPRTPPRATALKFLAELIEQKSEE